MKQEHKKKLKEKIKKKAKEEEENCRVRKWKKYFDKVINKCKKLEKKIPKKYLHLYTVENNISLPRAYKSRGKYTKLKIGFRKSGKPYLIFVNRTNADKKPYGGENYKIKINRKYFNSYFEQIEEEIKENTVLRWIRIKQVFVNALLEFDKYTMKRLVENGFIKDWEN